jgi:Uma2 family endonuclease
MTQLATDQPLPGTVPDPLYPDSDGRFMGDTDFHAHAQIHLREGLQDFFAPVPDVYVGSNLIYYYEKGNPRSRRDPDVLVARGVGKHPRRSYRLWEEKVVPCTFFEISSKKTYREDLGKKRALYEKLQIPEYFLFEPEGPYLNPRFQGFRLMKGLYIPLSPDAAGALVSKELGLRMVPEESMLRLHDLKTREPVLTRSEQAEQERQRADREKRRADALEVELKRLRKQLGEPEQDS